MGSSYEILLVLRNQEPPLTVQHRKNNSMFIKMLYNIWCKWNG